MALKPMTAVRIEHTIESILTSALHEANVNAADLPSDLRKSLEKSVARDLHQRHQQKAAQQRLLTGKIFHATLAKKYALMIQQSLGPRPSALTTEHKPTVEKILDKHHRDAAWAAVVDNDIQVSQRMKSEQMRTKAEMMRIQKESLDLQMLTQRQQKEEQQRREAAQMREINNRNEQERLKHQQQMAEAKQKQIEKQREVDEMRRRAEGIQQQIKKSQKELDAELTRKFVEDEERRQQEDMQRRALAAEKIRQFVSENDLVVARKREKEQQQKQQDLENMLRFSALPTGGKSSNGKAAILPAYVVERNERLMLRKEQAAQAYVEQQLRKQEEIQRREEKFAQRVDDALRSPNRHGRESVANPQIASITLKKLITPQVLEEQSKYRHELERQIEQKQRLIAVEKDQDAKARQEVELGVLFGELEERRMRGIEKEGRQRNLEFLKKQLDIQKQYRSHHDVTPKV